MKIGVLSDTHDSLANLRLAVVELGGRRLVVVHYPDLADLSVEVIDR